MTGQADAGSDPAAGSNPFGAIVQLAVDAQERSLNFARSWSGNLLQTVKDQAEDSRANLATLSSSLTAIERALEAQEEANRAIRQSLEGYREILERFGAANERSTNLVQTAVDDLKAATEGQLKLAQTLLTPPEATTGASEPFTELMQAWNNAFRGMVEAATPKKS